MVIRQVDPNLQRTLAHELSAQKSKHGILRGRCPFRRPLQLEMKKEEDENLDHRSGE
jgi:hypothetical protein